jgi:hypothetical protein
MSVLLVQTPPAGMVQNTAPSSRVNMCHGSVGLLWSNLSLWFGMTTPVPARYAVA